ncbi:MAG: ATP-binding cassette domain-containing protein [Bacilli bacterium]|nr:ATP-binding cassette domain-containing protein [Bacilli bacterium]
MKVVLQDGIKDCGICCLLSIIRYYRGEVSKEYLREITSTTKDGTSFYNLIEGATAIGFDAKGLTGKLEEINVNNLPCIVHFIVNKSYKHFVVLYKINKNKKQVYLMDPAKGKKIISFSEFNLLTSNNYLFLKPIKQLPVIKKKNIIYKKLNNIIKQNKILVILITILTFSYFLLNILVSFHFKYILEFSINYNITNNLLVINYILLILYFLKNLNNLLKNLLMNKWILTFDNETTLKTYKQILLLPYLYYKNRTTGEVVARFKDLNTIRVYLSNFFSTISTDLISIIVFGIILFNYNIYLTCLIFFISFLIFLVTYFFSITKKKLQLKISKYEDKINTYLIEGISNVDTIKGSHLEKRLIDKFLYKYKNFLDTIYNYSLINEIFLYLKNNLSDIIHMLIYGLGSYYVIKNKLSLSSLIIYQLFSSYFLNSFFNLIMLFDNFNSYKIALSRVEEIFLINKENFKNNFFYLPYTLKGSIVIDNLNYKVNTKVLFNNLNLKINPKEKILLCGESGSGKSTLVKMLMRYIETDFGNIKISDIDINHYHLENLRNNITYITSNEYLFTDTIKNNILLNKEIPDEEFYKICKLCLVDDIVKNSDLKYEKIIEENGFNFSNGERQRIILARSLLRKSSIYIFDEALGQIDINKEKKILTNIFNYLEDKIIIVISHRFNNKKLFDRVLKLDKGVIIEN